MPTEAENINYLYLVLTYDCAPTIDWDAVSAALDLNKGTVTKRWSRLKQSIEKGDTPAGSVYPFLWLCVKHHKRDKAPNWVEIAKKCNTTTGAASKRYSRMKKAFEENDTAPGASPSSPVKNTPVKPKTPRSKAAKNTSSGDDVDATPTPKRKRATPKKKVADDDEAKFKPEPEVEDDDDLLDVKPKRPKATPKPKVAPKPKSSTNGAVKEEVIDDEEEDTFFEAPEQPDAADDVQGPTDEVFDVRTEAKNERKSFTPSRTGSTFTSKFLQHRAEYYLAEPADSDYLSDSYV